MIEVLHHPIYIYTYIYIDRYRYRYRCTYIYICYTAIIPRAWVCLGTRSHAGLLSSTVNPDFRTIGVLGPFGVVTPLTSPRTTCPKGRHLANFERVQVHKNDPIHEVVLFSC